MRTILLVSIAVRTARTGNDSHAHRRFPWRTRVPDPFDSIKGLPLVLRDGGHHTGLPRKPHMWKGVLGGKQNIDDKAGRNPNDYSGFLAGAPDRQAAKPKVLGQKRGNFRGWVLIGRELHAWRALRTPDELYHLGKNPHRTGNLTHDPAYAETLTHLRAQLMNELEANDDPRLAGDAFDRGPRLVKEIK